jgi:hypothetical protein
LTPDVYTIEAAVPVKLMTEPSEEAKAVKPAIDNGAVAPAVPIGSAAFFRSQGTVVRFLTSSTKNHHATNDMSNTIYDQHVGTYRGAMLFTVHVAEVTILPRARVGLVVSKDQHHLHVKIR